MIKLYNCNVIIYVSIASPVVYKIAFHLRESLPPKKSPMTSCRSCYYTTYYYLVSHDKMRHNFDIKLLTRFDVTLRETWLLQNFIQNLLKKPYRVHQLVFESRPLRIIKKSSDYLRLWHLTCFHNNQKSEVIESDVLALLTRSNLANSYSLTTIKDFELCKSIA